MVIKKLVNNLLLPDASRRQQPPRIASQQANEPDKSGASSPDLARYSRRFDKEIVPAMCRLV